MTAQINPLHILTVTHNQQSYDLLNVSQKVAEIEALGSEDKDSDCYWLYSVTGMHKGEAIKIAVKNVRYEPDGDETGVWYALTHDGMYWADDFTDLDDDVCDAYSDVVMAAAKEDYQ